MNKIAEAITYFEEAVQESDEIIKDSSPALQAELTEQKEHFVIALAALREKLERERERGCEYCNSRFGIATHHINGALLQAGTKKIANYCPMCGAYLQSVRGDRHD